MTGPTLPQVDDRVADEVVKAYYPTVVSSGDAARTRAQTAYTIASAVATAIIAAGIFGGIEDQSTGVKVLAVMALVAWLVAAGLFMFAVAGQVTPPNSGEEPDGSAFVRAVIGNAHAERRAVAERSERAMGASVVAMAITLVAVLATWLTPAKSTKAHGAVALTPRGARQVAALCEQAETKVVNGSFDPGKLAEPFVVVELDDGSCSGTARTVRLRKATVLGAIVDADD